MATEQNQPDRTDIAFNEISVLIAKRGYNSFTLRLEILKPNRFVTACMKFHDQIVGDSKQEFFD